jgi:hypothetical protein
LILTPGYKLLRNFNEYYILQLKIETQVDFLEIKSNLDLVIISFIKNANYLIH